MTAAVDAIHLRKRLNLQHDIEMSGQVVWTGKSAMDIRLQLTQVAQHAASFAEYAAPCDATQTANLGLQSCLTISGYLDSVASGALLMHQKPLMDNMAYRQLMPSWCVSSVSYSN